jgi:hypothetical protein
MMGDADFGVAVFMVTYGFETLIAQISALKAKLIFVLGDFHDRC